MEVDHSRIERYKQRLRQEETPEPEPWCPQELQDNWERGNRRRPLPPNFSDNHIVDLYRLQLRWQAFCQRLGRPQEWKALLKTLTFDNKGLGESFIRYLMRDSELRKGQTINSESSIRVYTRRLGGLYKKYTAKAWDKSLRDHLREYARLFITSQWGLRREPKVKPTMGPDLFIYHIHYLWVRDTSNFHIGLDRLDDATIRHISMFSGCRKHELVYARPTNHKALMQKMDEESDAYTDVEHDSEECMRRRGKECWVCGQPDERTNNPKLKVLCWEDIDFWILRDPEGNGGRDRLAMQILLRWHKGENRKIVPTWFTFVEEDIPAICPVSHILAKALAEGVIDHVGYQTGAEPFFRTRLNKPSLKIRWKREWWHRPVFRQTLNALGEKSNDPLTAPTFDSHSKRLGIAMGIAEKMTQYVYRRGFANCVDSNYRQSVRDQGLRHRPNSTIYQEAYHNARSNAVVQDAFLGRGTASPYLAIFNHMGLRRDENAPKGVSDELMHAVGPSSAVRRLEEELEAIKVDLEERHGRVSSAPNEERRRYKCKQNKLRTARQKHRRKVHKMIYTDHFDKRDEEELQKQLQGIQEPEVKREVKHTLTQRARLADILSDMDDDLPEEEIVQRKVEAINAMVTYAYVCEPVQRNQPTPKRAAVRPMSHPTFPDGSPPQLPLPLLPSDGARPLLPQSTETPAVSAWETALPVLTGSPSSPQPLSSNGLHILAVKPPEINTPPSQFDTSGQCPLVPVASDPTQRQPYPVASGKTEPCIFCGKRYARKALLWDHLEQHFQQANGGPISCPRPECQAGGIVLEDVIKFKAHAARHHGSTFRKIKIISSSPKDRPDCVLIPTKRRIRLIRSEETHSPRARPQIILLCNSRRVGAARPPSSESSLSECPSQAGGRL